MPLELATQQGMQHTAGMATRSEQQAFIAAMLPHAIEASRRTGVDPRIIIAQAAVETGWGAHAPGNNYFGIKSHGQAGGNTLATREVIDGRNVTINDSFRAYPDMGSSVAGYADFLLDNPRYAAMMRADGLDAQLAALGASGYATDPNYSQVVGSIARGIDVSGAGRRSERGPTPDMPLPSPAPAAPTTAQPVPPTQEAPIPQESPVVAALRGLGEVFQVAPERAEVGARPKTSLTAADFAAQSSANLGNLVHTLLPPAEALDTAPKPMNLRAPDRAEIGSATSDPLMGLFRAPRPAPLGPNAPRTVR
jgi:hypothetical protein